MEIPAGVQGENVNFVVSSILLNGTRMSYLAIIPYILSFWQGTESGRADGPTGGRGFCKRGSPVTSHQHNVATLRWLEVSPRIMKHLRETISSPRQNQE